MKLLLVEDEEKVVEALTHILKKNGYVVDAATDGERGMEMAAAGIYDIIVLDRMLPHLDGVTIIKELRSMGLHTPVLLLTAKDSPKDRVEGLDAGADDYLVKPFFTEELLARLRALTRRQTTQFVNNTLYAAGMAFDPLKGEVTLEDQTINLTVKESMLLELLMRNAGQVLTKERILEKVWGYDSETDIANVDLYIFYLRKKLNVSNIKTVRGIGYFLQGDKHVS